MLKLAKVSGIVASSTYAPSFFNLDEDLFSSSPSSPFIDSHQTPKECDSPSEIFTQLERTVNDVLRNNESCLVKIDTQFINPIAPWNEKSQDCIIISLGQPRTQSNKPLNLGVCIFGLNSRGNINEQYKTFLSLVGRQISSSLMTAHALEQEKKRADALVQLDKAKTTFFNNISHEFRTPITLMLGPLEDNIRRADLPSVVKEDLTLVYRNGQRLLKLVNILLDFSRIEAGRMKAIYRPIDLSTLTGIFIFPLL